jgi:hypothetical protein
LRVAKSSSTKLHFHESLPWGSKERIDVAVVAVVVVAVKDSLATYKSLKL